MNDAQCVGTHIEELVLNPEDPPSGKVVCKLLTKSSSPISNLAGDFQANGAGDQAKLAYIWAVRDNNLLTAFNYSVVSVCPVPTP